MRISKDNEKKLTAAMVRRIFSYDPETGSLTWREKSHPMSNQVVGREAGCRRNKGYRFVGVGKRRYFCHRVIWLWMTGSWPLNQLDHRDGDGGNNRWANLREATQAENNENLKCFVTSRTGYPGIRYRPEMDKFQVRVTKAGVTHHLGSFKSLDEAIAVRRTEKEKLHKFEPRDRHEIA